MFSLGNEIIQTRVKPMFCYCGFLSISSLPLLEPSTTPLFLEILNITFLLLQRETFLRMLLRHCHLSIKTNFVCLTNHSVLLPVDAKYKDEIQREKKMLELVILLPVLSRDLISRSLYFLIIFSVVSELRNGNEIEGKFDTDFLIVLSLIMLQPAKNCVEHLKYLGSELIFKHCILKGNRISRGTDEK